MKVSEFVKHVNLVTSNIYKRPASFGTAGIIPVP